jgi:small subunit ribosomal protein S17
MSGPKSMTGTVVSDKMAKTVIVKVERTATHRLYKKIMRRSSRYLAHDDHLDAKLGDTVRIVETRPMSRLKRWRVAEIVQRGEVAEIAPREIDAEYLSRPREKEEPAAPKATSEAEDSAVDEGAQEALSASAAAAGEEAAGDEKPAETPEEQS